MNWRLIILVILISGCKTSPPAARQTSHSPSVFEVVVTDMANQVAPIPRFGGSEVWVSPRFAKGDSLFYSWGDEIDVSDDLVAALRLAAENHPPFPADDEFGSEARVTEIESFHDLFYYQENMRDVDAKCLMEFWPPAVSDDGKRCLIRFYFGPSAHGAAGTYVLKVGLGGWEIVDSTFSYYL